MLREADDAMSPAQISDATGMPPNNTRQLLYKMVQSGEVRKIGRGRYVAADLEGTHNNDNAVTTKS